MVDDRLEDTELPSDAGRPKRAPPTIDLEAVSSETKAGIEDQTKAATEPEAIAAAEVEPPELEPRAETTPEPEAEPEPAVAAAAASGSTSRPKSRSTSRSTSPWLIAPLSGAVAAILVLAAGWALGFAPGQPAPAVPPSNAAAIDDLTGRVVGLESKINQPADSASTAGIDGRIDTLDKSLAALRAEVGNLRAQSDKLAAAVTDIKSAPRDAAGAVDLSGINDRIAGLERTISAQSAAIAQAGEKIADAKITDTKAADDTPLRRVVAAALLDVAVRHGDPYAEALAAAKSLSPNPDALKPLDVFAVTGVPNPPMLDRELMDLVPKLQPTPPETAATGTTVLDRLQAGAAKLVRVERTDGVGNDRGAVMARVIAAALRNNLPEARRELNALAPADRAPAQAWLDKAAARDAAYAASRQFADESMTALAESAQTKSAQAQTKPAQ